MHARCAASLAGLVQGRSNEVPFLAEFAVVLGAGGGYVMTAVFKCADEDATDAAVKVRELLHAVRRVVRLA